MKERFGVARHPYPHIGTEAVPSGETGRKVTRLRRKFGPAFKAKVALEAVRSEGAIPEVAARHGLHPNQVYSWRKLLLENAESVFAGTIAQEEARDRKISELYSKIGQLTVERDSLAKKIGS